jgi:serine/threonine protein kinase
MLQINQILSERYLLKKKLGQISGRQTWLAEDLNNELNQKVILKLLAFGGDIQWQDLKLFEREAQTLKQLNHSRIPKYIDYFSLDDRLLWFVIVQEYIFGHSLQDLLSQGQKFSELEVRQIALKILDILIYLHQLNPSIIHRDIKPSNLILTPDNYIFLLDFGSIQDKAARKGVSFTVVGTYGYTPFEQFGGCAVPASDLYALGATLIHLLTGISPAELPQQQMQIQFRQQVNISSHFLDWLEIITSPSVEDRFQNALEAKQALLSNDLEYFYQKKKYKVISTIENTSGCGLFNRQAKLPAKIARWNWGAFLLAPFWSIGNRVWIGTISLFSVFIISVLFPFFFFCAKPETIDKLRFIFENRVIIYVIVLVHFVTMIVLGIKGNKWGWKSTYWKSIEQFHKHQKGWLVAGVLLGLPSNILSLMLLCLYLFTNYGS